MATAPLTGKPKSTLFVTPTYAAGTHTNEQIYVVPANTISILIIASLNATGLTFKIRGVDGLATPYFGMFVVNTGLGISYTNIDYSRLAGEGFKGSGTGPDPQGYQFYMYPGETFVIDGFGVGTTAITYFIYELSGS